MKNKYEVLGIVGEGAYGIVYKCLNKETNKYVAVKKFKETQDKLVQKTMKRELAMLQMLHHENVVEFQESFVSKGNFFLVFEYVEKNLLEVLEESPRGLSPKLIRSLVFQMCKAVDYLHKNNMIHRDVKPENLLIDENLNLKLCDFGFARKVKLNKNNNNIDTMTDYVATRWYRSPELLLSGGIYGPEVDYWAIGCIMGELADGNPMFPGEDEVDQLDCIIKILGNLPESLVNMYYENPIYNGKELLKIKKPETLEKRYLGILSPTAIDFMKGLLELDPNKRLNGENVFKHKYFSIFMKNNNNNNNNNTIANNNVNTNNNLNNSNSASNIKVNNNDKAINNKINNNININKIILKNNPNANLILSNSNTKRNDANLIKEAKSNVVVKNYTTKEKDKDEIPLKKTEKDKQSENAYTNRNNNNSVNNIVSNINPQIPMYVNGIPCEEANLRYGDSIFILGLKLSIIRDIFYINNPNKLVKYDSGMFQLRSIPNLDYSKISKEPDPIIEMYKKDDYFLKPPRFDERIEDKTLEIDPPPQAQKQEEMPAILTMGSMMMMGMSSMMSGVMTLSSVVKGETQLSQAAPSLLTAAAMLTCMLVLPQITKMYNKHKKKVYERKRQASYSMYISKKREEFLAELKKEQQILIEKYIPLKDVGDIILYKKRNLWEKNLDDYDFLSLRLGIGAIPPFFKVSYPAEHFSMEDEDNLMGYLRDLEKETKMLENVPVTYSFQEKYVTGLIGAKNVLNPFLKGLLLQMMAFHGYDTLKIAVFTNDRNTKYRKESLLKSSKFK